MKCHHVNMGIVGDEYRPSLLLMFICYVEKQLHLTHGIKMDLLESGTGSFEQDVIFFSQGFHVLGGYILVLVSMWLVTMVSKSPK